MKRTIMALAVIAGAFTAFSTTASAEESEVVFSYADPNAELGLCGFGIADTYDVCIKIENPGFTDQGAKVVGVQIPVVNDPSISNYSVWVTSDYGVYDYAGKPVPVDGCRISCTPENGMIDVRFGQEIKLPAKGLYVGYTFTVANSSTVSAKFPVVCTTEGGIPNSFFIRTHYKNIEWDDWSSSYCSPIKVILRGDFNMNCAGINPMRDVYSIKGETTTAKVTVVNNGINEIESLGYTLDIDGEKTTGTYTFAEPLASIVGTEGEINIEIPALGTLGDHQVVLTVDKVNGKENKWEGRTAEFHYVVVEELPYRRVVMEEWTGTWCQYCTRGFAGMEMVKEYDPNVILISYHFDDVMQMKANYPEMAWSYPSAYLDKNMAVDPLTGSSDSLTDFGYILNDYAKRQEIQSPVFVDVKSTWNDDKSVLDVDATAQFIYTPDEEYDYRFAYVVVADGLCAQKPNDPMWWQQNYYGMYKNDYDDVPFLRDYAHRGTPITDMVYDDVAIYASPYIGVENSIKEISGGNPINFSFKVKTANCTAKKTDEVLVQDPDNVSVVVMVVRSKGLDDIEVLNANICKAGGESQPPVTGVEGVAEDAQVVSTEYFDIAGHRISADTKGLQIAVSRYSDGTSKANKRIIK